MSRRFRLTQALLAKGDREGARASLAQLQQVSPSNQALEQFHADLAKGNVTGRGGCRANGATSNSPGRSPGYDGQQSVEAHRANIAPLGRGGPPVIIHPGLRPGLFQVAPLVRQLVATYPCQHCRLRKTDVELLSQELRQRLPALRSQETISDPIVHAKFFTPDSNWTWFVTEGSPEGDDFIFFGYVCGFEEEWGYFSLNELESVRGPLHLSIERDLFFRPAPIRAKSFDSPGPL